MCRWSMAWSVSHYLFLMTLPFIYDDKLAGTSLHALRTLQHPQWEDYDYESADVEVNRLYWLGDGQTYNEKTLTGHSAS